MATSKIMSINSSPAKQISVDWPQVTTTIEVKMVLKEPEEKNAFAGILMVATWDTNMTNQYIGGLFCRTGVTGYSLVDIVSNNTNKPSISYDKTSHTLTLTFSSANVRFVRLIYT